MRCSSMIPDFRLIRTSAKLAVLDYRTERSIWQIMGRRIVAISFEQRNRDRKARTCAPAVLLRESGGAAVSAGLLRASAHSAMLAVRMDEVLITRAVASVRQCEIRVHQATRAHLPVNQLRRRESAGTPLKPIKNAAVVIWVAEWSFGRQELVVHGVHRRRDRATH